MPMEIHEDKIIMRAGVYELHPSEDIKIGVDMTPAGAHVVAMRGYKNGAVNVIYSQFHPVPKALFSCCCGEPWRLNTVHREKTPCFDYIEHEWVGLTEDERTHIREGVATYHDITDWNYAIRVQQATELKLKEKNYG